MRIKILCIDTISIALDLITLNDALAEVSQSELVVNTIYKSETNNYDKSDDINAALALSNRV